MLSKLALILQVNRACNLRCDYCYTGSKAHHPMADAIGRLVEFLWGLGLRRLALSLDLWTQWKAEDLAGLALGLRSCADLWRGWLPQAELNYFSEKAATLGGWDVFAMSARCGFGVGQVAVASSGRLYPCERVIGDDLATQPLQLPGTVWSGSDFLEFEPAAERSATACQTCALRDGCGTRCRCSNFIRTGQVDRPDRLLCEVEKIVTRETVRVLNEALAMPA